MEDIQKTRLQCHPWENKIKERRNSDGGLRYEGNYSPLNFNGHFSPVNSEYK
jgi:hypothetical protein